MIVKLRLWGQKIKQRLFIVTGIIALLMLITFIFAAYIFGWNWTGFLGGYSKITITNTPNGITTVTETIPGKTLWDWLQLLGVLAIPIAIAGGTTWFSVKKNQNDLQIAKDQRRETRLKISIDSLKDLIFEHKLRTSEPNAAVRVVARYEILMVVKQLDKARKGLFIRFLAEAGLLISAISLNGADLNHADLRGIYLTDSDLTWANLSYADLRGAFLRGTHLNHAALIHADLRWADLTDVVLNGADLRGAHLDDLADEQLVKAKSLEKTIMPDGKIHP